MKKTKILCTIGPASKDLEIMRKMCVAGMNGIRINTTFGDFDQYEEIIRNTRTLGELSIMMDINGPGLRLKMKEQMTVKGDDRIILEFNNQPLSFNYNIYDQLELGDQIFIDDGRLRAEVVEKSGGRISLLFKNDGVLSDGKGVNIPRKSLKVPAISEKDAKILQFAEEMEVEFIGLSFCRSKGDIQNLRKAEYMEMGVIAKIENFQGVENFDEILEEADGIMIARGDLGVEIEAERVPLVQKQMIQKCSQHGKLVITATDMLDSMIKNPVPTRAEVSDVANAILDGTDAVMLSGETAVGRYPVESVSTMTRIAVQAERGVICKVEEEEYRNISSAISRSVWQLARTMPLSKVVTMTRTGYTARAIARFKLKQPIIAVTNNRRVKNQLALIYGVQPILFDYEREKDRILGVANTLHSKGLIDEEDLVLFTAGFRTQQKHASNIIEIHIIRELLEFREKTRI